MSVLIVCGRFWAEVATPDRCNPANAIALWVIGGYDDVTSKNTIFSSTNGTTWSTAGTFPVSLSAMMACFRGSMWILGGNVVSNVNTVYVSSDGLNWRLVGNMPSALITGAVFVHNERMWFLGGSTTTSFLLNAWITPWIPSKAKLG